MFKPSKLYVDTNAIKYNLDQIQKDIGKDIEIMPVLKSNAYGIGIESVSGVIKNYNIVGVANIAEAMELKKYYKNKIFIMYQPSIEDIPIICDNNFEISVSNNIEFLKKLNKQANNKIKIHINVETGSGILGVQLNKLKDFCKNIKELENIMVNGIFMHYSCSESLEQDDIIFSNNQSEKFQKAIAIAEEELGKIKYKHAGCSSATFSQPSTRYNLVRMGLLMYGYGNLPHLTGYIDIKPCLKFTTKILQIETFPEGACFGYGRTFKAKSEIKVATIAAGYAEGIHRKMSNNGYVVINGKKAPIIGRVCMNLTMIDITNIDGDINCGDEVIIFDNENIKINEVAKNSETNIAECMMHIGKTVERVVI